MFETALFKMRSAAFLLNDKEVSNAFVAIRNWQTVTPGTFF